MDDRPISLDEAQRLLEDAGRLRRRDIPALLRRVEATARQVRDIRLTYDVEMRRRVELAAAGRRSAIAPEEAVRFLTPAQQEEMVNGILRDRLEQQRRSAELTQKRREAVERAAGHVRAALDTADGAERTRHLEAAAAALDTDGTGGTV